MTVEPFKDGGIDYISSNFRLASVTLTFITFVENSYTTAFSQFWNKVIENSGVSSTLYQFI